MNELLLTGLAIDVAGAGLLAAGLGFVPRGRVQMPPSVSGYARADIAHAKEAARVLAGLALLALGLLALGLAASGVEGDGRGWLVGLLAVPIALLAMRWDRSRREQRIFLARAEQRGRDHGFEEGFERVVLDFEQALAPTGRGHAGNESPEAWLTWLYGQGFADEVQRAVRSGAGGSGTCVAAPMSRPRSRSPSAPGPDRRATRSPGGVVPAAARGRDYADGGRSP
jgi:hypothetical protein